MFILLLAALSCNTSISADALFGKWNYIKVIKPNANPPDSVRMSELKVQAPFIQFSKDNKFMIIWGGTLLSHGTFSVEGKNILIKEVLPDGTTRQFPFWVSELTGKEIIFETKGEDGSRVTAVKE